MTVGGDAAVLDRVRLRQLGYEDYARLVELKGRHGPANVFRFNQNIKP